MRKTQNIFSPKASRVLRVLLIDPFKGWTIEDLSKEAKVSLGFTHATVMSLIDQGHVDRNERYRLIVSDPVKLLQRWAAFNNYTSMNTFLNYHTFERDIEVFTSKMQRLSSAEYALTALAGANLIAPYVRPTTIHFYIKERDKAVNIANQLDLRPTEKGGNVSMVLPYDEGVFYGFTEVGQVIVVSKVQLYVDLFNYPARGEEAADALLEKLEKEWSSRQSQKHTL
ncbi:MAG: type IV toxin-antitoxin system AbiEi family antitoxin [Candidatus Bathyarchaeia archaeon]|jgi:hypothetical protein